MADPSSGLGPPGADRPWWQTGVVYQVYPRAFQDSNGDGVGDLEGVRRRLAYLAWLGVDALWLSPFYPSPGADGGYDVADYCDVHPELGTLATFDALVTDAHALGLRVLVDWVPNHSSSAHPWFEDSRRSRSSARRDWYVWRDPAPGDGPASTRPPTNWLSAFGGPAWTWDAGTDQFYLHSFLPEQPDLNWRAPALARAMRATMQFWIDRGVDGFRVDVAHHVLKDPAFRDNPPEPAPDAGHKPVSAYDRQQHVHDRAHPDVHALFRRWRAWADAGRERPLLGEIHLGRDLAAWARYAGTPEAPELHLPLNFGLLGTPLRAAALRAHVEAVEAALPAHGWPSYVWGSHDERRLATRLAAGGAGEAGARLAAMLLLTLRGTPTLYAGDEIGTPDVPVPPERQRDPAGLRTGLPGLGRDGGRTPMAWDGSPSAGFSSAPPDALWLPLHEGHERIHVAAQRADPRSLLSLYRRLLAVRRAEPALYAGAYRSLDAPDGVFAYERSHGASRAVVALNLGPARVPWCAPPSGMRVAAATRPERAGRPERDASLEPWEGVVWTG